MMHRSRHLRQFSGWWEFWLAHHPWTPPLCNVVLDQSDSYSDVTQIDVRVFDTVISAACYPSLPSLGLRIPCLENTYRADDRVYKSGDGLKYVCE